MATTAAYGYGEGDSFQIVSMPYEGDELEMIVILPKKPAGLPALEAKVDAGALAGWSGSMSLEDVSVTMPRFTIRRRRDDVAADLEALGMTDALDRERSDFFGMSTGRFTIDAVVHEAFVNVDEAGTEAAAATAVVVGTPSPVRPEPKVFTADRPFLFLVRDVKRGTILFMGRMVNPKM